MSRAVTCHDGIAMLMDYVEGRLPAARRQAVDRHVAGCRRCQGFVASYSATPRIFRRATEPPAPARLARRLARLVARLRRRGRASTPRSSS